VYGYTQLKPVFPYHQPKPLTTNCLIKSRFKSMWNRIHANNEISDWAHVLFLFLGTTLSICINRTVLSVTVTITMWEETRYQLYQYSLFILSTPKAVKFSPARLLRVFSHHSYVAWLHITSPLPLSFQPQLHTEHCFFLKTDPTSCRLNLNIPCTRNVTT